MVDPGMIRDLLKAAAFPVYMAGCLVLFVVVLAAMAMDDEVNR